MKGPSAVRTGLSAAIWTVNVMLVAAAAGGLLFGAFRLAHEVAQTEPPTVPSIMEDVDWHDPASSQYCLACHRQVGVAMGGLDVERGHSQNVELNEIQRAAVKQMGTKEGPDGTLICMSCHVLGQAQGVPAMLADTLTDSQLCRNCHPEHNVTGSPHDLRVSAPHELNRLGATAEQGGPCSACHLSHRFARDIAVSDLDPEGYCLPCHSRSHAAQEHERTAMDHPVSRCRDCHDPHDWTYGEFLAGTVNEVCTRCHEGYGDGAIAGMHPIGQMEDAIPEELLGTGANDFGNPHELTCVSCHSTHDGARPNLLYMAGEGNRLCLTCHEKDLAAGGMMAHATGPVLNPAQEVVVASWGGTTGPDGELLCVSCHIVHRATAVRDLLAFQAGRGEACVACHPSESEMIGSSHDLRTNFPDEINSRSMTTMDAGACSACHLSHRFARDLNDFADASGRCTTCHQAGEVGAAQLAGHSEHPNTACTDCHDPHERRIPDYLIETADTLCLQCHQDQRRIAGGPHDYFARPESWPEGTPPGRCLPCHVPHWDGRPDLLRVEAPPSKNHDEMCLACHPNANWSADSPIAAIHPQQIAEEHSKVNVVLVPTDEHGEKRMGCVTCHNPHAGGHPAHLARVSDEEHTEDLCLRCHVEKQLIKETKHSAQHLHDAGYEVEFCKPCHAMHAQPSQTWGNSLSPRFLEALCDVDPVSDGGSCVPCQVCHRPDSAAPVRAIATHPNTPMVNTISPDALGYLPLYNVDGMEDIRGQVTCRTCHVSHGRLDLLELLASETNPSQDEQSAIKAQIRPYTDDNLCTTCHGLEARARFLYFHDPRRRPSHPGS